MYDLCVFVFLVVLGFELNFMLARQVLCRLCYSASPVLCWVGVSQTVCPCWLQTVILLISVSWVARIIGLSHWCPADLSAFVEMPN
jgi:hypothetical protein